MPNVLAMPPVQVPSISRAASNALAMRATQENIRGAQTRNVLAKKQLAGYDAAQETAAQQQGFQNEARAISTALKAGNTEQATSIYKQLGGKSDMGISIAGNDVSIDYGVSTIKGPSGPVAEFMEQVSVDPTWMTDPAKAAKSRAWMAAKGISFEKKAGKETLAEKTAAQKEILGEKLKGEKELADYKAKLGTKTEKSPTTAMAQFLKKNPDATTEDIASFLTAIETAKAEGKAVGTGDKAVDKDKALKRISDISKAIATLEKTDTITQLLAKDNPELAQYIGQKIDPDKKAALMDAWNNELDYLEQFSGTTRKKEKVITPTGGGVTHTFVPGQGLVPAGQ